MKLAKTLAGQQALKDRGVTLSPRQRSAFILFDGKRSTEDVLAATRGIGVTQEDVNFLVGIELLAPARDAEPVAAPVAGPRLSGAERYSLAYPLATALTAGLGLRGVRLNLAVEAAADDVQLLVLLPKLQEALGVEKCRALEQVLRG